MIRKSKGVTCEAGFVNFKRPAETTAQAATILKRLSSLPSVPSNERAVGLRYFCRT
jgi:hypothetical protein